MGTEIRWLRNLWRRLGSIRLAAVLLFVLLLASTVASLYPQMPDDPSLREPWLAAARLRYGPLVGLWQALGLFDGYRSPWFLALLSALLLNALVCTVQRFFALCRSLTRAPAIVRPAAFYRRAALTAEWPVAFEGGAAEIVRQSLVRLGYRVRVSREAECAHLYAERCKWARLGSPVSHAAAIAFLLALVVPTAFGLAIGALSVYLLATLVALWMPHRRLWLRLDAGEVRMVGVGEFGSAFEGLVETLFESCGEARAGGDG